MYPPKRYLGDGVYAVASDEGIELTTEDGVSVTNVIFLEPSVMIALEEFVKDSLRAKS